MTWEPRPMPQVNPETREYWESAGDNSLLVSECRECGLVYHYPRANCPDCFSGNVAWREAMGQGEVYSYSVTPKVTGWPEEDLPLVLAYVELDEGPRMMTNIVDCDSEDVDIGTRVEVTFVETEEDIGIPVFTPVDD